MFQMPLFGSPKKLSRREEHLKEYLMQQRKLQKLRPQVPKGRTLPQLKIPVVTVPQGHIKKLLSIVPAYLLVVVAAFIMLMFGYFYFTVRTVSIGTTQQQGNELKNITYLIGRPMFLLSTHDIERDLLTKNPLLESISVQKEYPQTLRLTPRFAKKVGYIEITPRLFIVLNHQAKVVEALYDRPSLPLITHYQKIVSSDYSLGSIVPYGDIQFACALANLLQRYGIIDYSVMIQDTSLITLTRSETRYLFSYRSDTQNQLNEFEQMIKYINKTQSMPTKIDFRFERVIIDR